MKNILKHITLAAVPAALLLSGFTAAAQNYPDGTYKVVGGVAFNKSAKDNHDGTYTVDLESFVTGKVHTETIEVPADITLVMDVSSSMATTTSTTNVESLRTKTQQFTGIKSQNNRGWTYTNLTYGDANGRVNYQWYYKHTDGNYYAVRRANNLPNASGGSNARAMWVIIDGNTKYLTNNGLQDDYDHTITSSSATLWTGPLYKGWTYTNLGVGGTSDASNVANQYYYLHTYGNYYPVRRANNLSNGSGSNNVRAMWVVIDGQRKYLTKDGLQDDYDHTVTESQISIYFDYLYRGWTSGDITVGTHYYKYEGSLYRLQKQTTGGVYTVYFEPSAGVRYYLNTTAAGISTEPCPYATAATISLYFGDLYKVGQPTRADGLADAVDAFIVALSNDAKSKGLHHRLAMVEYSRPRWIGHTSGTDDINNPIMDEGPITGLNTHIIKGLRDVTDDEQVSELRNAVVLPSSFQAASYMSYGLSITNKLFDEARANPLDENEDGVVDEYKRPQIAILICDGGSTDALEDNQAALLAQDGVVVYVVHVTNSDYGFGNVREVMEASHPEKGNTYYDNYTYSNRNSGRYSWDFISPVEEYDERLVDAIVQMTEEIGGAELEVEGTAVTVDVVSQAFSVPPSGSGAPQVFVAKLTGQTKDPETTLSGEEFVYYTFGTEIPAASFGGDDENITLTEETDAEGNKVIKVEGFDYSKHWCGKDSNSSSGYHADGYKLILRFVVEPNDDAVGGPEVKTNTEDSGIYVDGTKIATFNQPTVELPVQLWIQKDGLNGNDSAVFTIYYADPNATENVGKDPKNMTYQSFTKVVVNANTVVDGKKMVKITGLDSKFYYRIKEDAWAWTYDPVTGEIYTSEILTNPIIFENEAKETVKQAEAVKHNVF